MKEEETMMMMMNKLWLMPTVALTFMMGGGSVQAEKGGPVVSLFEASSLVSRLSLLSRFGEIVLSARLSSFARVGEQ